MSNVKLLPLHLLEAFSAALKGERGELDAWLEVNNEDDVRLHVEAYARACVAHAAAAKDAENEALRAVTEGYVQISKTALRGMIGDEAMAQIEAACVYPVAAAKKGAGNG